MERLLQNFTTNETVNLVSPYVDNQTFTKKITTRNSMFLPFNLIPHVIGQNLTPQAAVRILSPVMTSLRSRISTIDQFPIGSLYQDCGQQTARHRPRQEWSHFGTRLFKVNNTCKIIILHKQLSALGSNLGHTVSMPNIATEGTRVALENNMNQCFINDETRNRPITFGERYPHLLDYVLKLCDVEKEEDLPII